LQQCCKMTWVQGRCPALMGGFYEGALKAQDD
jgi:hypothetical protein